MNKNQNKYNPNPKYKQIANAIKDDIREGKYKIAQKVPGVTKLSKMYKASAVTANRAIEELTSIGMLRRDARSGTYVASVNEPLRKITVLMSNEWHLNNPQLLSYLNGVIHEASSINIEVHMEDPDASIFKSVKNLNNSEVQGMILWAENEKNFPTEVIAKANIPKVAMEFDNCNSNTIINYDRTELTRKITEAMINKGAKRIAFIGNKNKHNHYIAYKGYLCTVKANSIYNKDLIFNTAVTNIESVISKILNSRKQPDSIIIPGGDILKALALLWKNKKFMQLGGFEENTLVKNLRGSVWLAELDHFTLGARAVQELSQIVNGVESAKKILFTGNIFPPE
jgi:DNA-binding transcriptional regulator YhcF (GntR family)